MSYTNDQYEGMGGTYVIDKKGQRQPVTISDDAAPSQTEPASAHAPAPTPDSLTDAATVANAAP